jgi:hypothetical protein
MQNDLLETAQVGRIWFSLMLVVASTLAYLYSQVFSR